MSKKNPNPDGKKGGDAHKQKVEDLLIEVKKRQLEGFSEYPVATPDGKKKTRYVDVAGLDKISKEPTEFHQVGKVDSEDKPVKREQEAIEDIEKHSLFNIKVQFHAYNKPNEKI